MQSILTTRNTIWAAFIVYILFILFKHPGFLYAPMLKSDDIIYFKDAYSYDFIGNIINIKENYQYLNLFVKLSMWIAANAVSIHYAPHIIVAASILPFVLLGLVIISDSSPFKSPYSKILAMLTIAFIPQHAPFLSLNYSHFYFALSAVVVLASYETSRTKSYLDYAVLLFVGLSSPVAIFLLPAFILVYFNTRNSRHRNLLVILLICLLVQTIAYCSVHFSEHILPTRYQRSISIKDAVTFIFWLTNISAILPFFGTLDASGAYRHFGHYILGTVYKDLPHLVLFTLGATTFLIAYYFSLYRITHQQSKFVHLLLLSFFLISIPSFLLAIEPGMYLLKVSTRYNIAPCAILIWIYIIHAENISRTKIKHIFAVAVAWIIIGTFYNNWLYSSNPVRGGIFVEQTNEVSSEKHIKLINVLLKDNIPYINGY